MARRVLACLCSQVGLSAAVRSSPRSALSLAETRTTLPGSLCRGLLSRGADAEPWRGR
jgi:hypothetical protein